MTAATVQATVRLARPRGTARTSRTDSTTPPLRSTERGPGGEVGQLPHALERAAQRYGLCLRYRDLRAIARRLRWPGSQPGLAVFLFAEPGGVERWRVRFGGTWLVALYDRSRDRIVTFLK